MEPLLGEATLAAFEQSAERPLAFIGRWLLQPSEQVPGNFDSTRWEHFKANITNDLAVAVASMLDVPEAEGRFEETEPLMRDAFEGRLEVLGAQHPQTLDSMYGLGLVLKELGRLVEAIPLMREDLESWWKVKGATKEETLHWASDMAMLLEEGGRAEEATRLRSEYGVC